MQPDLFVIEELVRATEYRQRMKEEEMKNKTGRKERGRHEEKTKEQKKAR